MMVVLTASQNLKLLGQRGCGRPKKTWKDMINNDLRHWKLSKADPGKQNGVEKET